MHFFTLSCHQKLESHIEDYCRRNLCYHRGPVVPMGIRKQDRFTWVATVSCPMLFISSVIDGLYVSVFLDDFIVILHFQSCSQQILNAVCKVREVTYVEKLLLYVRCMGGVCVCMYLKNRLNFF